MRGRVRRTIPQEVARTSESRNILGKGRFRRTRVYHATHTTADRESRGSHLNSLKECFNEGDIRQCSIIDENGRCLKDSEVGAHVYFNNDEAATAEVCQIIPTCKGHNNAWNCRKKGHNFGGEGVEIEESTPFTVRRMKPRAFEVKGRGKGMALPEGELEADTLLETALEFMFFV